MKTTSNRPSHRVYAVTKTGERNYWREIGAAWSPGLFNALDCEAQAPRG